MFTVFAGQSRLSTPSSAIVGSKKAIGTSAFATALMASAAFYAFSATPASATCVAVDVATYDACASAGAWALDPAITLSGVAVHDGFVPADIGATPGTLTILSGGDLTNTAGGFFHTDVALTINSGGIIRLDGTDATGLFGFDTFASLAGAGTLQLTVAGTNGVVFGGNNANTSFSGTVLAPSLNNFLRKIGTGRFTINNMTMAEGELLDSSTGAGGLTHSAGTSNIKSIAVGTGLGASNTMTMSGGTLNITGTVSGVPCGSNCPALRIGDFDGVGVLNQTGGTIKVGGVDVTASYNLGNQGGTGTHNISGGVLQLGDMTDPVDSAGLWAIGRSTTAARNSVGTMNLSGTGLVDVQAGQFINGDRDAAGAGATTLSTINMTGGTFRVRAGANLYLSGYDNANAIDSIFNLNGGVLEIGDASLQANYAGGGAYEFNLGNGTIRVIGSALTTTVNANLTGGSATTGVKIDTNGLGANWNGILSGTGWIVKTGLGNLTLGGVNTYTGGTAFNGGAVIVDAVSDLGDNSAAMSFNGGALVLGANNVLLPRTGGTNMAGTGIIDTNGFSTIYDGAITGAGTLNKTGLGTLDLGGNNNAHTGALNIFAGEVRAIFGSAIGNTSIVTVNAPGSFRISTNETIGSLAGNGSVDLESNILTTGNNNLSSVFSGSFVASSGGLTKVGTGTFTVNGGTAYTGLTTVSAGQMNVNGTMADSLLVAAGARFGGNATVSGNVTNNGTIAPGNSIGTQVYAGNYTAGAGAVFDMEVQFNNAGAPVNGTTHDFVDMTNAGATITGTTLINVIPFPPSGSPAATTGNGVQLVRVAAPVAGNQFQLAAPVVQGPYQYLLTYRPNYSGALDGWFLTSQASENMYGEAAMFSSAHAMFNSCFRGDDQLALDGNGSVGRAWAKVTMGNRNTEATTGIESSNDYTCGSGGLDVRMNGPVRIGVSGGYGESDVDVVTPTGIGRLDGDGGLMQVYAAFHHEMFFASLSIGYGNMNWTFDGPVSTPLDAALGGMIGTLQAGATYPMGAFRFSALGEVSYNDLTCNEGCLLAGTVEDANSFFGRATLRVDAVLGQLVPFVAASVSSGGGNTVTNGTAAITTDTESSILTLKGGATINISENAALFANAGMVEGLESDVDGWDSTGGVRIFW